MLNSNISWTCSDNIMNFGPLAAEIGLPVWGTTSKFQQLSRVGSLLHQRRSTEVNQTLYDVWPSLGLIHCIYIFGAPAAKFTLRPSFAFYTVIYKKMWQYVCDHNSGKS